LSSFTLAGFSGGNVPRLGDRIGGKKQKNFWDFYQAEVLVKSDNTCIAAGLFFSTVELWSWQHGIALNLEGLHGTC